MKSWKRLFGSQLEKKYKKMMDDIMEFQEEVTKRISRPIKDLEDVRQVMEALASIRERQIEIDMALGPIEVSRFTLKLHSSVRLRSTWPSDPSRSVASHSSYAAE